jgi:hypothetical protein
VKSGFLTEKVFWCCHVEHTGFVYHLLRAFISNKMGVKTTCIGSTELINNNITEQGEEAGAELCQA